MAELLTAARRDRYAVGSFDIVNLETCRAVLETAVELRSPVIIAIPEHFGELCGFENLVATVNQLAAPLPVPVATILDHGRSFDSCMRALRAGMTSVMLDGSRLPFAENVAATREVVRAARSLGVTVEGEVGHVGRGVHSAEEAEDVGAFTQPEEAAEFVRATGVDALAVAVGTSHGLYRGEPHIDFDLLRQIDAAAGVPLVLHGGSSTGDERLARAVAHGVCKVNIFTDMSVKGVQNAREVLAREGEAATVLTLFTAAREGFREVSAHYMRLFGSAGRA
jgi:fructose-bisphosphate aldolase class II